MNAAIPTLNRCGYQMGSPSPLLQPWLDSYDGTHPLLDIGCAYGINTLKAAEKCIPVVAIDPEGKHLDILRGKLDKQTSQHVTCTVGALPDNIRYPNDSFSGILCSEVLHFMDGRCIEESIQNMYRKLIPNGKLMITVISHNYLKYINPERENRFQEDLKAGVKWPGVIKTDCNFFHRLESIIESEQMLSNMRFSYPDFINILSDKQLTDELIHCGFIVRDVKYGDHPGHPDVDGFGRLPGQSLQIVAEKL